MFALVSVGIEAPPINFLIDPGIPILLAAGLSSILPYVIGRRMLGNQSNCGKILFSTLIGSLAIGLTILGITVTGWVGPVIISFAIVFGIPFLLIFAFMNQAFSTGVRKKLLLSISSVVTLYVAFLFIYSYLSDFLFNLRFLLAMLF